MSYKRINLEEKEQIYALYNQGLSDSQIAEKLKRSQSTVSRELKRFGSKANSSPSKANNQAEGKILFRGRKRILDIHPEIFEKLFQELFKIFSPEQISKKIKKEYADEPLQWISHETIYKYIYAFPRGELRKLFTSFLRSKRLLRKDHSQVHSRRGQISDATPISERPEEVDDRKVPGHWEGDLIIGKNHKSALATLVERTTRLVILAPIKGKDAKIVRESFSEVFEEVEPSMKKSMTYDRGLEMAEHKKMTEETGVKVYFADPRSPWQRGTNENTNGLIRQYFPKKTDFSKVSIEEIKFAQNQLNERPRKVLDWETPKEAFERLVKR
ncbi:MAG: IS30 family transposase [Chlamydiales bacterium]|jgi:IS30 family transposase